MWHNIKLYTQYSCINSSVEATFSQTYANNIIVSTTYRFAMLDGSSIYEAGIRCSTSSCESIKCGGGRRIKWIGNSGDSWCSGSRSIADVCGGSVAVETSSECCEDGLADPDDNTSLGCWWSWGLSTPSSTSSGT